MYKRGILAEQELLLSNAFTDKANPALELKVKIININPDKKYDLLDKCTILKEYSEFVEIIRKYKKREGSFGRRDPGMCEKRHSGRLFKKKK